MIWNTVALDYCAQINSKYKKYGIAGYGSQPQQCKVFR